MKLALSLIAMLVAAPAFAGDKEAIQALDDQFSVAATKGDAAALAAMYAPDATILPPGSAPVHGQDGAKALFGAMAQGVDSVKLTATDVVRLSPDYIREVGVSEVHAKGAAKAESASYVVVWKRVNGQWKLWTDIFH
jgi:uncharacterized protein (TIGR02246 family)